EAAAENDCAGSGVAEGMAADCLVPGTAGLRGSALGERRHAGQARRPVRRHNSGGIEPVARTRIWRWTRARGNVGTRPVSRVETRPGARPSGAAAEEAE